MVNSGLILLPGKLACLLVRVYNMHPLFERGNNGQNCAYYNQIFTVVFRYQKYAMYSLFTKDTHVFTKQIANHKNWSTLSTHFLTNSESTNRRQTSVIQPQHQHHPSISGQQQKMFIILVLN